MRTLYSAGPVAFGGYTPASPATTTDVVGADGATVTVPGKAVPRGFRLVGSFVVTVPGKVPRISSTVTLRGDAAHAALRAFGSEAMIERFPLDGTLPTGKASAAVIDAATALDTALRAGAVTIVIGGSSAVDAI